MTEAKAPVRPTGKPNKRAPAKAKSEVKTEAKPKTRVPASTKWVQGDRWDHYSPRKPHTIAALGVVTDTVGDDGCTHQELFNALKERKCVYEEGKAPVAEDHTDFIGYMERSKVIQRG